MKPLRLLALAALLLAGCAPPPLYYRQGVTAVRVDADLARCQVRAAERVPVKLARRYIPPVYDYRRICSGTGSCHYVRVLISPGRFERYDANEGLRNQTTNLCMIERGYQRVKLPPCETDLDPRLKLPTTRPLPPITSTTCAVRSKTGRWQIVTP